MSFLSVHFHLHNHVSVFGNFSQNISENVLYIPEINVISEGTLIKAFYLLRKTNQKKSEKWFCRWKTVEVNNAKINFSLNIPCSILLFKASTSLQIFFPRNLLFQQKSFENVSFLKSKCLTFLYLFISLLKNIHQKHKIKEHTFLYLLTNLFP